MKLFNWNDKQETPFGRRYRDIDEQVLGRDVFEQFVERLPSDSLELGDIIRGFDAPNSKTWQCPRLFISHRMKDYRLAMRIARIATSAGWDYWLDVHDPALSSINSLKLSAKSKALAVALIIEVALLNCTHLVAAITPNSPRSAWIPYEYGRVKPNTVASQLAACWLHRSPPIRLAEYMNLGPILRNSSDFRDWLSTEKSKFVNCP